MKKRKFLSTALAAVLTVGSMSAVSFAETTEIREDSKYEITLDKEIVDGEEKAVVAFSGLPKEVLTFEYSDRDKYYDDGYEVKRWTYLRGLYVNIDGEDDLWGFHYLYGDRWFAGNIGEYGGTVPDSQIQMAVEEEETKLILKAYFDPDDAKIKCLESKEKITVSTYLEFSKGGTTITDEGGILTGDSSVIDPIISGEEIDTNFGEKDLIEIIHVSDMPHKERVKITNNLNKPAESEPTESAPATSEPTESTPAEAAPGDSDKPAKQETLEATLKNVDSEKGIEGAALDKLLFGESGWAWNEVERVEFTSEKPFSVQFAVDNDGWKTLGEEAARAETDGKWSTEWTLNASEMAKDKKYAKVISKEGTTNVKATIYLKKGAAKPSGEDQKPTGITLAIAPAILAAGAAVVLLKKRK